MRIPLSIPMGEYGQDQLSFDVENDPAGAGSVLAIHAAGTTYHLYERDWTRLRDLLDRMDTAGTPPADPTVQTAERLALARPMLEIARRDATADRNHDEARAWDEAGLLLDLTGLHVMDALRAHGRDTHE